MGGGQPHVKTHPKVWGSLRNEWVEQSHPPNGLGARLGTNGLSSHTHQKVWGFAWAIFRRYLPAAFSLVTVIPYPVCGTAGGTFVGTGLVQCQYTVMAVCRHYNNGSSDGMPLPPYMHLPRTAPFVCGREGVGRWAGVCEGVQGVEALPTRVDIP